MTNILEKYPAPWRVVVWDYDEDTAAIVGADYGNNAAAEPVCLVQDDSPPESFLLAFPQLLAAAKRAESVLRTFRECGGSIAPDTEAALAAAIAAAEGGK